MGADQGKAAMLAMCRTRPDQKFGSTARQHPMIMSLRSARHRAAGYCFHFARSFARSSSRRTSELVNPRSIKASSNQGNPRPVI
jgi:hypothetical protein